MTTTNDEHLNWESNNAECFLKLVDLNCKAPINTKYSLWLGCFNFVGQNNFFISDGHVDRRDHNIDGQNKILAVKASDASFHSKIA